MFNRDVDFVLRESFLFLLLMPPTARDVSTSLDKTRAERTVATEESRLYSFSFPGEP
jgi:hypothetical protein